MLLQTSDHGWLAFLVQVGMYKRLYEEELKYHSILPKNNGNLLAANGEINFCDFMFMHCKTWYFDIIIGFGLTVD